MPAPIVINARAAVRREITGVERWAREMVARLPQLRPEAYVVRAPRPGLAHRAGHAWEQGVLPATAARSRAPVVFSPANVAPLLWPRNVVVLHDAVLLSHPEWFSTVYRIWHEPLLLGVARRASRVIVPSHFSANELAEFAGAPRDRIDVVPGGVDERFTPDADPEPARRSLGLDRPYVLTVGDAGLRKNVRALAPTVAPLRERGIELVSAGTRRAHHPQSGELSGMRGLGYVAEELLPSLYAGALGFVFPSLHEGFGLPCVEAMRSGVPVAASERGAIPEACGGAALLFDPDDPEATTAAVLRLVEDEQERARLRAAGLVRAAELGWDRTASAVDRILADAARAARPS